MNAKQWIESFEIFSRYKSHITDEAKFSRYEMMFVSPFTSEDISPLEEDGEKLQELGWYEEENSGTWYTYFQWHNDKEEEWPKTMHML